MKKTKLLHSRLSSIIAEMGHTDTLCIGDAGLPFPDGVESLDLAVARGIPAFEDVLDAIISEMPVEEITIAVEIRKTDENLYNLMTKKFPGIPVNEVPHAEFKKLSGDCKLVVRTGECVPFSNIILHADVVF